MVYEKGYVYLYKIDKTTLDFSTNEYKYYYVTVDTTEDLTRFDNKEIITVYSSQSREEHQHYNLDNTWLYDELCHWQDCDDCGVIINMCEHVYDNSDDKTCNHTNCEYIRVVEENNPETETESEIPEVSVDNALGWEREVKELQFIIITGVASIMVASGLVIYQYVIKRNKIRREE